MRDNGYSERDREKEREGERKRFDVAAGTEGVGRLSSGMEALPLFRTN